MMPSQKKSIAGSALIEALVSVLIFFIGLIALVGMTTQASNSVGQSKVRNDASLLASELVGEMWVSPTSPLTFNTGAWQQRVASELPSGLGAVTVAPDGVTVDIKLTWVDKKNPDPNARSIYWTTAVISKNN